MSVKKEFTTKDWSDDLLIRQTFLFKWQREVLNEKISACEAALKKRGLVDTWEEYPTARLHEDDAVLYRGETWYVVDVQPDREFAVFLADSPGSGGTGVCTYMSIHLAQDARLAYLESQK